jgi:hypothetical protein
VAVEGWTGGTGRDLCSKAVWWKIGRAWSGRHERVLFLNRHAFGQGKLVVADRLEGFLRRYLMGDERLLTPQR